MSVQLYEPAFAPTTRLGESSRDWHGILFFRV